MNDQHQPAEASEFRKHLWLRFFQNLSGFRFSTAAMLVLALAITSPAMADLTSLNSVACSFGDTDCDGDVDLDDLIAGFGSFTGPCTDGVDCLGDPLNGASIFTKVRSQGDVHDSRLPPATAVMVGDGDVDIEDLVDMMAYFDGPLDEGGPLVDLPGNPTLTYDSSTGGVTIDSALAPGGVIMSYVLKTTNPDMTGANYIPFGSSHTSSTNSVIGEIVDLVGESGSFGLGNILPTGMDQAGLDAFFLETRVTGSLASLNLVGVGETPFDLIAINVAAVPEPSTCALAAISLLGLGFIGWRRKRA